MSEVSIHGVKTQSCCDILPTNWIVKKFHWAEIASIVTASALIILAFLAFSQAGAFAQATYAIPFGYCCLGIAGLLISIEIAYKLLFCCTQTKETTLKIPEQKNATSPEASLNTTYPETPLKMTFPEISLKERCKTPSMHTPISATEITYSPNRDATEKMAIQLDFAVREGRKNKKKIACDFAIDLTNNISKYLKDTHKSSNAGIVEAEGNKNGMEDAALYTEFSFNGQKARLAGIFDGHGDKGKSANYLKEHLPNLILSQFENITDFNATTIGNGMTAISLAVSNALHETGGTTAVYAFILKNKTVCVNVGDSRICLIRNDAAFQLTEDANLESERFRSGIGKIGYPISEKNGVYRIFGALAVGRDLGSGILSRPKITSIERGIADDLENMKIGYCEGDYLLCASDGLWDVITLEEASNAIHQMQAAEKTPSEMAAHLTDTAIKVGSTDNVSVVVVML